MKKAHRAFALTLLAGALPFTAGCSSSPRSSETVSSAEGTCAAPCAPGQTCVAGLCQVDASMPSVTATATLPAASSVAPSNPTVVASVPEPVAPAMSSVENAGGVPPVIITPDPTSGSAGSPSGVPTAPGAGGEPSLGAGGGSSGGGGSGGVDAGPPDGWHGALATGVTEQMLQQEYDAWKSAHVAICDNGSAAIDKGDGRVVSEGIAYGMLLSANMDDRTLFDQLWRFYGEHLNSRGLMNWDWQLCAEPGDNRTNAASDAEMDAIMALLQANQAWPDGDYLAQAEALAGKVLEFEVEECSGRLILRPGDTWGGCSSLENRINPSYFSPGYYRAFAFHFPSQAEKWNALLEGTYQLYPGYEGAASDGPYPDWSNADGSANGSGYYYDAARTPWRIATDYAWSGDPRAATELSRVSAFVDANGGIPVQGLDNNSTFSGAFALSGITDQSKLDDYVGAWLSAEGDDKPYFQGTLRVIYLLLAGGRFSSTL